MSEGMKIYKPCDLTYAAYKRCRCGAGLAYPKTCKDPFYFWACGFVLTNDIKYRPVADQVGPFDAGIIEDANHTKHDCAFSFVFHAIQPEILEGTEHVTTRPEEDLVPVKAKRSRKAK